MSSSSRFKSTIVGLVILAGVWTPVAWWAYEAAAMSSEHYVIPSDTMSVGGNESSSSSFSAFDTIGEGLSGENMQSTHYLSCIGFQCGVSAAPYISFTVSASLASGGAEGGTVNLGTLGASSVKTSDGTSVNSIFLTAASNAVNGSVISVQDVSGGLASTSVTTDKIVSQTATLTAGSAGFGVCVFAAGQRTGSPSTLDKTSPFDGSCTKTNGHSVGAVSATPATILAASGELEEGTAEVLVKAAASATTPAHQDYSDTLTFIMTATF